MKNVLVLGGAGYIGGLVTDYLKESNKFMPIVADNLLYEERYMKDVIFSFCDVRDTWHILALHKSYNFDSVVFLAAIVGDPACNVNPSLTEEVNYEAVKRLCEQLDPKVHMIFASTCSVYGANEEIVFEDSATKPLSCYASTKLRAEQHVLDRGGTVFRLGTVYGVGDNFSRIRADLVVNTLTIKAFSEGEITVNGGAQWRPIISVKDIARYIFEACERKGDVYGIYNLGYKNTTITDLADEVLKIFPTIKVNRIGEMYQDERNYKVSTSKVERVFKYRPQVTVESEILELYDLLANGRIKNPSSINYHNGLYLAHRRV